MKSCFMFQFSANEKNITSIIPLKDNSILNKELEIINICDSMNLESDFGIHDVCGLETVEFEGVDYFNEYGFMSDEIEEDRIDTLMNIWKSILSKLSLEPENIITIENAKFK